MIEVVAIDGGVTNTQDGRHTAAYVTEGLTKQLADAVNRDIR